MKRRHLYVLLFALPALLASAVVALALFGAVAGGLWIFVFGDKPWPPAVDMVLVPLTVVALAATWAGLLSRAYAFGKRQEEGTAPVVRHVAMAGAATALLVLLVVSYQWRVGNVGPKDDGTLCELCRDKGFAGSGMPPLAVLQGRGFRVALVTDGRMSGASGKVPAAIQVSPEAAAGGPLAKMRDGDRVRLDADAGTLEALVPEAEWAARELAQMAEAPKVANSHGVGRALFSAFRRNALAAEEGACTWL